MLTVTLAAAQPTLYGRKIHTLSIHDGRLRFGYGDYSGNTGPIHVLSADLTDLTAPLVDEATLHTEQILRYVPTSVGLLCPFMDPQQGIGNPEEGSYALLQPNGSWVTIAERLSPYPVHIFDATDSPAGLIAVGTSQVGDPASATYGQVWASGDGGGTWESSFQLLATSDDQTRFMAACTLAGTPVAFAVDLDTFTTSAHAFDGSTWTQFSAPYVEEALAWHQDGVPFAFCLPDGTITVLPGAEGAPLAEEWAALGAAAQVACLSSGMSSLYVLAADGRLLRHDGTSWAAVFTLASAGGITSLAVDDERGVVLFGTTDSRLLSTVLPD